MPVLRDMVCLRCGKVECDIMANVEKRIKCNKCGRRTLHRDACRGGHKSRVRINDWPSDPAFYRGQVTSEIKPVVDADGETIENVHTGRPMADSDRFSDESRAERRDRIEHDTDRTRGTLPQIYDQSKG